MAKFNPGKATRTKTVLNKAPIARYKTRQYRRGPRSWSLGYSERANDQYGVYVHSSVKNFAKQIRLNDIDKSLLGQLQVVAAKILPAVDKMIDQVKPTEEMRKNEELIFNSIGEGRYSIELNNIKQDIQLMMDNLLIRSYSKIKNTMNTTSGSSAEYPVVDRTTGAVNRTTTNRETAIQAFRDYMGVQLGFITKTKVPDKKSKYTYTLHEDLLESTLNITIEEFDTIITRGLFNTGQYEQQLEELIAKGTNQNVESVQHVGTIIAKLHGIVDMIERKSTKVKGITSESTLDFFKQLNRVEDILKQYKGYIKQSGNLYELTRMLDIYFKGFSDVTHLGNKAINKYNASDIDLKINAIDQRIGVTLKQTHDFKKVDTKLYFQGSGDRYGLKEKGIAQSFINNYKYFMLNYSILSNWDSMDMGIKTLYKDQGIMTVGEIKDTVMKLNEVIGVLMLTQTMLGPIFFKTFNNKDLSFEAKYNDTTVGLPYILSTQDGHFWTYDLLHNVQQFLETGDVAIDFTVPNMHQHTALVLAKRRLFGYDKDGNRIKNFDPSTLPNSYREILHDADVNSSLIKLNKSVFQTTENGRMFVNMNTSVLLSSVQTQLNHARKIKGRK